MSIEITPSATVQEGTEEYDQVKEGVEDQAKVIKHVLKEAQESVPNLDRWQALIEPVREEINAMYTAITGAENVIGDVDVSFIPITYFKELGLDRDNNGFFSPMTGIVVGIPEDPEDYLSQYFSLETLYHEYWHAAGQQIVTAYSRSKKKLFGLRKHTEVTALTDAKTGLFSKSPQGEIRGKGLEEASATYNSHNLLCKSANPSIINFKRHLFGNIALRNIPNVDEEKVLSLTDEQVSQLESILRQNLATVSNVYSVRYNFYDALISKANEHESTQDLETTLLQARIDGRHMRKLYDQLKLVCNGDTRLVQRIFRLDANDNEEFANITARITEVPEN